MGGVQTVGDASDTAGGGGGGDDSENAGFKIPLNTRSFDSLLGGGSDHSNSISNEDIQSLVDIDCDTDMGDDLEGPENVELQQAILRSIIDSGDDPRSGSHYRTEDAYVSLHRLKAILVCGSWTVHSFVFNRYCIRVVCVDSIWRIINTDFNAYVCV